MQGCIFVYPKADDCVTVCDDVCCTCIAKMEVGSLTLARENTKQIDPLTPQKAYLEGPTLQSRESDYDACSEGGTMDPVITWVDLTQETAQAAAGDSEASRRSSRLTTQKRIVKHQKTQKKLAQKMTGKSLMERASKILGSLMYNTWVNRSYGVIGLVIYWLWRRDIMRQAILRAERAAEIKDVGELQAVVEQGVGELRKRSQGWLLSFVSARPRSSFGIIALLAFQASKYLLLIRSRLQYGSDPSDRLKSYPAGREQPVLEQDSDDSEEDSVAGGDSDSNSDAGDDGIDSSVESGSEGSADGSKVTEFEKVPSDLNLSSLERQGLQQLAAAVRGKGVSFNRKTIRLLRSMRHLASIGDVDSASIYKQMKRHYVPAGRILFSEGSPVDGGMYIVITGRLVTYCGAKPTHTPDGRPDEEDGWTTWESGTTIGESAVLDALAHPAGSTAVRREVSCRAEVDSEILQLDLESFQWMTERIPGAIVSWILSTTSRQWRVATHTLRDVLGLPTDELEHDSCEIVLQPGDSNSMQDLLDKTAARASGTVNLNEGETVYRQGELVPSLFVVLRGRVTGFAVDDCGDHGRTLFELGRGSILGGVAVFGDVPMRETVICLEDTVLAIFPRILFSQVATADHIGPQDRILVRMALSIARAMTPVVRRFLSLGMQRQLLRAGEQLFEAGDAANAMWLVISGRVRTVREGSDRRSGGFQKIARQEIDIGRGQSVGEISMFAKGKHVKHNVSCLAIRDTELVRLSRYSFLQVTKTHPLSILEITSSLANRLQEDSHVSFASSRNYATIAVVPAGGAPKFNIIEDFATHLTNALDVEQHSTQLMSSRKLEDYLGPGSGNRLNDFFFAEQVSQWLIDQEECCRFQILLTDATPSPWTKLCIRQADCILVVADADDDPAMSEVEAALLFCGQKHDSGSGRPGATIYTRQVSRKELVLIHRGEPHKLTTPSNTRRWFQNRSIREHHHVRWRVEDDFRRVARCLAGQAVGLVLGGGGSRGLAHLGVIQEMERQGIPIDYVGGTSQGAFVGAMYAATLSTADEKLAPEVFLRQMGSVSHYLRSLTMPILSYFSGANFNSLLRTCFGNTQIEDLWIRYFCCTTNVTERRLGVHEVGPLWRYLRASMTVMGLLPPMPDAENASTMLVDGGYVNNVPFDVMENIRDPGIVIIVDVEQESGKLYHIEGGEHVSGWWLLLRSIWSALGFGAPVELPSMSQIVLEVAGIAHYERVARLMHRANNDVESRIVYIKPDVGEIGLLDYHLVDQIIAKGQVAARAALSDWKARRADQQNRSLNRTWSVLSFSDEVNHVQQRETPPLHPSRSVSRARSIASMYQQAQRRIPSRVMTSVKSSINTPALAAKNSRYTSSQSVLQEMSPEAGVASGRKLLPPAVGTASRVAALHSQLSTAARRDSEHVHQVGYGFSSDDSEDDQPVFF